MVINAEVIKNGHESNVNLIRRFTKKIQSAGILPRLRGIRYSSRKASEYVKKKQTLKTLKRKEEVALLIRLGKMSEYVRGKK